MGSSASSAASKFIVDYIRDVSRLSGVSSVSLPLISSDELFKQYMNASVPYLIRNQAQIKVKLSTQGLVTRVNVLVSIDPFVNKDESELLSVIEMGELFARLCDAGVKVINISLCGSNNNTGLLEPAVIDNILDYLREILEEGLNLDVSGDALLERLSVQCTDESVLPGVVELVQGLGITRFTTSSRVNGNSVGEGLIDNDGKVVLQGSTSPYFLLSSMDSTTFAEKYLK
eukprot:gene8137-9692_t